MRLRYARPLGNALLVPLLAKVLLHFCKIAILQQTPIHCGCIHPQPFADLALCPAFAPTRAACLPGVLPLPGMRSRRVGQPAKPWGGGGVTSAPIGAVFCGRVRLGSGCANLRIRVSDSPACPLGYRCANWRIGLILFEGVFAAHVRQPARYHRALVFAQVSASGWETTAQIYAVFCGLPSFRFASLPVRCR